MKVLKGILFLLALQIVFTSLKANSISNQANTRSVLHSDESKPIPTAIANFVASAAEFEEDETDSHLVLLPTIFAASFSEKPHLEDSPLLATESNLQYNKIPLFLFIKKLSI